MILPASLYHPLYLFLVVVLTYIAMQKYYEGDLLQYDNQAVYKSGKTANILLISCIFIFFIGLRPVDMVFVDMFDTAYYYKVFYWGKAFHFTWKTDNFLFDNLFYYLASKKCPIDYFFLLIASIYFGGIAVACRKLFPDDTLLCFVVYLGAFSTFTYGTNGIKAGSAASIFLVALAYKENLKVCVPLLWVSLGFHHAMLAPIAAFVISFFFAKPKYCLYGWLICLFLAVTHITALMEFFSGYVDEHGAGYLNTNVKNTVLYVSGFRPDFILYSAVPIFLGYYYIQKEKIISDTYNFLWCVYTLTNCVFLLCTYGTFINRIAYLSWLMLPFVLLYPVLYCKEEAFQLRNLSYVVYGHLGFTLFMNVFYYGL